MSLFCIWDPLTPITPKSLVSESLLGALLVENETVHDVTPLNIEVRHGLIGGQMKPQSDCGSSVRDGQVAGGSVNG